MWANWSWKTRLWTWIELKWPQNQITHRISAQKLLSFPDDIGWISTFERAERDLRFWYSDEKANFNHRMNSKWWGKPDTFLLNDYNKLLNVLFSQYNSESARYREESKKSTKRIPIIKTRLDIIKEIWDKILMHRELIISWNTINTKTKWFSKEKTYNASEMSDWERVIFYLIWQALCAPENGIIIIDEPELHLHKSIQVSLWNEIEKERNDCIFIYLTHDIWFATSKVDSKKIWLKSFDWTDWDWDEYNDIDWIPEDLQLEIIWSRQKVLFVEWDNWSLDLELYKAVFPNFLVKPCWSCNNVINFTKAFRKNNQFTWNEFYWLIDRDRRLESEIGKLMNDWVFVLDVAEVENIFIVPELLDFLSEKLSFNLIDKKKEVLDSIIAFFEDEKELQIALRIAEEIKYRFKIWELKTKNLTELEKSYNNLILKIDFDSIKNDEQWIVKNLISKRDYKEILKIYNRKSLIDRISLIFQFQKQGLKEFVIRSLWSPKEKNRIIVSIKKYIPLKLIEKI